MKRFLVLAVMVSALVIGAASSSAVAGVDTRGPAPAGFSDGGDGPTPTPFEDGGGGSAVFCWNAIGGYTASLHGSTWLCHYDWHSPTYAFYMAEHGWMNGCGLYENPCWHWHLLHTP